MIVVIPYIQKHSETDKNGNVTKPKGTYVDYGVNLNTLNHVCLPDEEFYSFVSKHCTKIGDEYVLK